VQGACIYPHFQLAAIKSVACLQHQIPFVLYNQHKKAKGASRSQTVAAGELGAMGIPSSSKGPGICRGSCGMGSGILMDAASILHAPPFH